MNGIFDIMNTNRDDIPLVFPKEEWLRKSPEEVGFDPKKWYAWKDSMVLEGNPSWGQNPDLKFGFVVTKSGYLVAEFGDPNLVAIQSASVGKAFTGLVIQLLLDLGKLKSADDPIYHYWTGEGELSNDFKYMNTGNHQSISFKDLDKMRGGFPISNGWQWSNCEKVPKWATCSGDPSNDNFAHRRPGRKHYSSGGRWRLHQALTKVMGTNMKDFLDEQLFSKIGIKARKLENGFR